MLVLSIGVEGWGSHHREDTGGCIVMRLVVEVTEGALARGQNTIFVVGHHWMMIMVELEIEPPSKGEDSTETSESS